MKEGEYPASPEPLPGETKQEMWDRINPPIPASELSNIKPDSFCTIINIAADATYAVIQDAGDYYIFERDGKPEVELKEKCKVVAISVMR